MVIMMLKLVHFISGLIGKDGTMYKISLRKRDSTWEYRFQVHSTNGKQQYASKGGFRTKKAAADAGRENGTFIQPRALQHTSRVIHKELNMPLFDFHSLRHTHTTLLLEAGANPLDVQERLGHSHLAIRP